MSIELTDYIDFVELEKPEEHQLLSNELFSKSITINTENSKVGNIEQFDLVILGVPEDRNSFNKGAALAPNQIRGELYKLISPSVKLKICDLGNLKPGNTYNDTYVALKEVIWHMLNANLNIVLIGGTQELTLPVFQAFEDYQDKINLVVFDSRIDSVKNSLNPTADSYLFELLLKKKKLFKFVNVGHQSYLTEKQNIEFVNKLFHHTIRLGEIKNNLQKIEPIIRDSEIVSFDISSVRQSDAPAHFRSSPNGFFAEEACQIARYAGMGDLVRLFGLFETNAKKDINNQTSSLVGQMIWHYIEGLEYKIQETPEPDDIYFKTFIVGHTDLDYDMTFYKSMKTERWWLEVPYSDKKETVIISCSHDDYLSACNHEVPDLWWKTFQKLS